MYSQAQVIVRAEIRTANFDEAPPLVLQFQRAQPFSQLFFPRG
jgi:hypothetical protein